MSREILGRVQSILRESGFTNFSKLESSHAWTLSAEKAGLRAVVHLTDREELPQGVGLNPDIPAAADIRLKAAFPGAVSAAPGRAIGRYGQGGSSRAEGAVLDQP